MTPLSPVSGTPQALTKERIAEIAARLTTVKKSPTIDELEAILASEGSASVSLLPSGEIVEGGIYADLRLLLDHCAALESRLSAVEALVLLAAMDFAFASLDDEPKIVWLISCNDYFAPAADAEPITPAEAVELVARIKGRRVDVPFIEMQSMNHVVMGWVAEKRGIPNRPWRSSQDTSHG